MFCCFGLALLPFVIHETQQVYFAECQTPAPNKLFVCGQFHSCLLIVLKLSLDGKGSIILQYTLSKHKTQLQVNTNETNHKQTVQSALDPLQNIPAKWHWSETKLHIRFNIQKPYAADTSATTFKPRKMPNAVLEKVRNSTFSSNQYKHT